MSHSWVCKKCGSKQVEIKLWLDPNKKMTVRPIKQVIESGEADEDTYCQGCCEGGHGIKSIDESEENIFKKKTFE